MLSRIAVICCLIVVLALSDARAESPNLLRNSKAEAGLKYWRAYGDANVEQESKGNHIFRVRKGGHLFQDVRLPYDSTGKFALLIGRVSSERINPDGAITGLPYLYGYMLDDIKPGSRVIEYLRGQTMRCTAKEENKWVTASGIFYVPSGSNYVRFFLNQALRRGVPHNGSKARFDNLGLYLFDSEKEARAFVADFGKEKKNDAKPKKKGSVKRIDPA